MLSRYAYLVSFEVLDSVFSIASGGCRTDESLAVGPLYFSEHASALTKSGTRRSDRDRHGEADFIAAANDATAAASATPANYAIRLATLSMLEESPSSVSSTFFTDGRGERCREHGVGQTDSFISPIWPMVREASLPNATAASDDGSPRRTTGQRAAGRTW